MENKVTKDMLIGEVVSKYPETIEILMGAGMPIITDGVTFRRLRCSRHQLRCSSSSYQRKAIKIRRKLLSVNSSFLFFAWPKACHYLNCLIAPSTSVVISSE